MDEYLSNEAFDVFVLELLGENLVFKSRLVFDFYHSAAGIPSNNGLIKGILNKTVCTSRIERVLLRNDTKSFSEFLEKEFIFEQFKYRMIISSSFLFIEARILFLFLASLTPCVVGLWFKFHSAFNLIVLNLIANLKLRF